jgi:hypothetical protein
MSHQNIPEVKQDDVFVVIDYAPNREKIGRAAVPGETDGDGKLTMVNDYQYVVEIWEVNGSGSLIQLLLNSIDRQDIKDLWKSEGYAYYGEEGDIQNLPRTQENKWKRESMVELRIGTATGTEDQPGYIEDVEYNGTVPAQGRSGNHIITNT